MLLRRGEGEAHSGKGESETFSRINLRPKGKGHKHKINVYWRYLSILLVFWLLLIQYYERTVVKRVFRRCKWNSWEPWPSDETPFRVGLFADPQIMDSHSYPNRPKIVNWFTRQVLDNYHARNWKFFHYYMEPNTVFFLGDLFDGGRYWETDEWLREYERFNSIFPKKPGLLNVMSLPGNHDIGFGDTIIEPSLERFISFFGDTSSKWVIGNHTFVILDTISLSSTVNANISSIPRDFMENFRSHDPEFPTILLVHVPLHRDPLSQECGSERESKKPFPVMRGDQYQTVLDPELSHEVLTSINPKIIFSGDDHDFCHITHSYEHFNSIKVAEEITVKSCAMNMGISKPAIQLLSLYNPLNDGVSKTYETEICYLPDPYKPLLWYSIAIFASIIFIFWMTIMPKSFNTIIARRIPFRDQNAPPILPTNKKSDDLKFEMKAPSRYRVSEERSIMNFFINVTFLLISLFITFSLFYKGY